MTEIFGGLSVISDAIEEDDCIVYLLANLMDLYSMLVMAHEANVDVPNMEVVTEKLLHKEQKLKDRAGTGVSSEESMMTIQRTRKKGSRCH